ncbi:MAG: hypothetical protein V2A34_00215, partial [Lentisphaerota bacterium]
SRHRERDRIRAGRDEHRRMPMRIPANALPASGSVRVFGLGAVGSSGGGSICGCKCAGGMSPTPRQQSRMRLRWRALDRPRVPTATSRRAADGVAPLLFYRYFTVHL